MKNTVPTLLLSLVFGAPLVSADQIAGTIRERGSLAGIAGVRVSLAGTAESAVSDESGHFTLTAASLAGPRTIVAAHPAYRVLRREISLPGTIDLVLEPLISVVDRVEVTATRAQAGTDPATVTNIPRERVEEAYWGQDPALLMADVAPGFNAYSDSGNGIGYSYFTIRGFGQARTRVTLNGAPLNDAESGELFFIDLADFLATAGDIQIRRGVFGLSGLGGAVDITTAGDDVEPSFSLAAAAGSFGTRRTTMRYASGLIDGRWSLSARYSRVSTDGYRDQSWAEMWNAYLSLTRFGERSRLRLVFFGGPERTHLAYEGVPMSVLDGGLTGEAQRDRRFNPITYPGEVDTFMQPHYQLVHELDLASGGTLAQTLYAYQGNGSYDQFRANRHFDEYNLPDILQPDGSLVTRTDLVRRRNVDEWDVGWVPLLTRGTGSLTWSVGGEVRSHRAHHWGEVTWARVYPPGIAPDRRYYDYRIDKDSGTVNVAAIWRATPALTISSGLQLTRHRYRMHDDQIRQVTLSEPFSFALPRLGAVLRLGDGGEAHVNFARGMREPNFRDIYDPQDFWSSRARLEPEDVLDAEAGIALRRRDWRVSANVFWMDFRNAIVWAGALDDNGVPVYGNGARARHRGFEFDGTWQHRPWFGVDATMTLSRNTFTSYRDLSDPIRPVVLDGNRVAGYPDFLASLTARSRLGGFRLSLNLRRVGRMFIDNTEDNRRDPAARTAIGYVSRVNPAFTLVNLSAATPLPALARALALTSTDLEVRLNNALDARYTSFGYMGDEPLFIPAAGRNIVTTLRVSL